MKNNFAFGKINYLILLLGIVIVVIGFILMSGDGTTEQAFNPEIFSDTRIKVAPVVCLVGFLTVIAAVLVKPRNNDNNSDNKSIEE
ncbi:MAG: DUF3098 domain-containing protein [Bacteroidaceae bacterium]|nr:DUF3098 domain-containing protein [Bacteroidaceae bacterium]MCR4770437.1 DUF3098 domain-containing protein [Bacteroidaceae bacterium]